ncbi:MAG: electron transfer flavoprotein subunit alpha/FixB family protein [Myxococcales bacterium]|nr:electron transfer flavoprotein subunit alpha/FixB family protein [Myxococcales bacterium]MCB9642349.1 electron transfer flavoprotein subunit alpha/FixB family protein [Myxococcales bacterium]
MASILLIAEQYKGSLRKVTFNGLGFAKQAAEQLGLDLHILIAGSDVGGIADELQGYGAKAIHVADDSDLEIYRTEPYTQVVCKLADEIDAQMITAAATVQGKDLLPRIAGRLGAGMASDIVEMLEDGTFKRPVWAGSVIARVRVETDRKVVSTRGTAFEAPKKGDDTADVNEVDVSLDEADKVRVEDMEETKSERPELTEARVVVSGGRSMKDDKGVKMIEELSDLLGAAMGASRAACDAGLVPNELQVGQTGKVVAPELYFAIGISGAIQHLAGMKGSKVIVAINKDPEAPIFQLADYGLVADMFKVVPEMVEEIKKRKGA